MAELLLELLSEEIPARMQARAAEDLKRLVGDRLKGAGLAYEDAHAYVTPRRLALVVTGLPKKQPDITEEKKGPRLDAPDKAIEGFLKSNGLKSLEQAEVRDTGKGKFYFAVKRAKGQATAKVLPGIIAQSVQALPWPKSMRWADGEMRWVRPLHGALAIFDGTKLSGALELGNGARVRFGNVTFGHRFLAPKKIAIKGFADYRKKLKTAKVLLDQGERRAEIVKQAKRLAARAKLKLKDDPDLLDEVTGLVEWPVVLMGRIDDQFMDLPPEVLTTAMRAHQKYLALLDKSGKPANRFLVVANMTSADKGKTIVAGNERVLRARLADARFFWDQDRKRTLSNMLPVLDSVVFHAKLGSVGEKSSRISRLASKISDFLVVEGDRFNPGEALSVSSNSGTAGKLCKADLVSEMVQEFPELQGIMGGYYALAAKEHPAVAKAIKEHYSPLGPDDACPTAPVSVAVALADKIDTLVSFWAIGETPTGSKDPFALRRAALGVIRLIVENKLRIPLNKVLENAFMPIGSHLELSSTQDFDYVGYLSKSHLTEEQFNDENIELRWEHDLRLETLRKESHRIAGNLLDFFADRMKVALRHTGVRHDLILAIFALSQKELVADVGMPGEVDLVRILSRVEALSEFLSTDDGANLLMAYRRASNIVRIEEKRDERRYDGVPEEDCLQVKHERNLFRSLNDVRKRSEGAISKERFRDAMSILAKLSQPVDAFFDNVTVNCDDPKLRENRLELLAHIKWTINRVADFSKIEG